MEKLKMPSDFIGEHEKKDLKDKEGKFVDICLFNIAIYLNSIRRKSCY
jgi:hypothetical protein